LLAAQEEMDLTPRFHSSEWHGFPSPSQASNSFFYYFLEVARLMMSIEAEKVSLFIFFRLLIDTTQSS